MILKKIPLKRENKEEFFDAVVIADDKYLEDQVDQVWEKMISLGYSEAECSWGPFKVVVRPRSVTV
jgi:hypothetical protein